MAQKQNPVKGDWYQSVKNNMEYIELHISDCELKKMSKSELKKSLNQKINNKAFQYLQSLRLKKGSNNKYDKIQMSEYLMPNNSGLSIEDKRQMFEIKNGMLLIFENFPSRGLKMLCKAGCDMTETSEHIYICSKYCMEENKLS